MARTADTSTTSECRPRSGFRGPRMLGLVALLLLFPASNMAQQVLDLCGCAGDPTLQPFDAGNPSTYPPGTTGGCTSPCSGASIVFTTPPDGVLRFRSFTAVGAFFFGFTRNAANTPITLLVAGDVTLRGPVCCYVMNISGGGASSGTGSGLAGVGGLGGNGGFRGGDGSALAVNGAAIGGTGLGPGGGAGGSQTLAAGGVFFGVPELLPLLGGAGGGGGGGYGAAVSCTGGGGGGGGGAIVIVANGAMTMQNYDIQAEGGGGGSVGSGSCATGGGGGSGGAIRLVANRFVDGGSGRLFVRGGSGGSGSSSGGEGRVRLESLDASAQSAFTPLPVALRVTGPSPLANPLAPAVRITSVGGQLPPAVPQGGYGAIDVVLSAPGVTGVDVATSGVPSGTTLLVTIKPRIGGAALSATVPLTACNPAGECTATTAFNLAAGAYFVEARATFQVQ